MDGGSKVEDSYGDKNGDNKGDWHGFKHDDWVVTTRGGHHICHDIHMLKNVRSIQPVTVELINGDRLTASVMGEVDLHGHLVLKNVLYISEYRVNLLSVAALTDSGCEVTLRCRSRQLLIQEIETNKTICIGKQVNGLCVIGCWKRLLMAVSSLPVSRQGVYQTVGRSDVARGVPGCSLEACWIVIYLL